MKHKRWLPLFLIVAMMAGMLCMNAIAEDAEITDLLPDLAGTYVELFPVMNAPEYDALWLEHCAAVAGEEDAAMYAEMLKAACTGTLYGEEAIAAYTNPEDALFNCDFLQDIDTFTIEGNTITGLAADGSTVFSHAYKFVGELASTDEDFVFALYESEDADAGEFTYFAFAPNLPSETYHIEFRHGDSTEDLAAFYSGKYAYWLAAGILSDNIATDAPLAIELFCTENLGAEAE